ncbi:unnamed protein product [Victoria cruziana]
MASGDWRSELSTESRQRIVNKIMETLKKYLPISGPEGLSELKKIAVRFEEKIYAAATSQPDYLRKISLKMLTMESKSSNTNPLASNSAAGIQNSQDPALHSMQQVRNPGQPLPISLPGQAQARQPILSQNVQIPVTSGNVQSTANMSAALPSVTGTTGTSLPGAVSQGSTLSSISSIPQNSVNSSMGQAVPTHMFSNAQRQVQARQQSQQVASQHQQQPQNQQFYHQQLQQMPKTKMQQQGNIQSSLLQQPHMQQHQSLLQPNQMQSSQPLIQTSQQPSLQPSQVALQQPQASVMQTAQSSGLQHGQQQSLPQTVSPVLQQHQQSMFRHQQSQQSSVQQHPSVTHQHQPQTNQASVLSSQQQQLMGQTNSSGVQQSQMLGQQNQMLGQQNTVPDLQQQQQRMFSQQNISNMQQQQQQQQQQLLSQQGNIPTLHQQSQQLGQHGNISGLQQHPQLLGTQSSTSNLQQHSHPMHQILQHSKASMQHQQSQQASSSLLQQQAQQSQTQPLQQQMMPQIQNQSTQLQQQMTMQQQPNNLQRELQKRVQTSGGLLQQPGVADQQKSQFQSQRVLSEASSAPMETTPQPTHATTIDWQEEVYQKIKALKDLYFDELNDLYQKLTLKCQQQEALGQTQMQSEQIDKLRNYRNVLKTTLTYLTIPKNGISPGFKDKIGSFEKQILYILNLFKARKPTQNQQGQQQLPPSSGGQSLAVQQQQQLPPQSGSQSLSLQQQQQQQQQTQPQISQLQHNESHPNQLQSVNLQNSVNSMQSSSMATMQHGSMPLGQNTGIPSSQQNLRNVLQSGSHMDSTQSSNLGTLQSNTVTSFSQGGGGSLQQNTVNSSSQSTLSSLPQSSMNTMQQTNVNTQANVNILQHQQQLKQMQQRHMQQQMIQQQHKQQIMQQTQLQQQYQQQQLHMHQKQQQSAQLQAHQMTQLHQMNDFNEIKIKPGVGLKAGLLQQQQQQSMGQRAAFQQLKAGSSFPVSSPQLLQTTSPQISQHSSPQVDQQSLLTVTSAPKVGTPMQTASSPFVVPSPSTPFSQSPLPGDNEKPGASPLSNAGNTVNQQSTALSAQAQSLAIGTPGLSPSPLLAEFTTQDGNLGGAAALGPSSKSSTNERPFDRLIKAVSCVSSKAFTSSINDITAVMNLTDQMVGSAPGNGARTAVGEDLAATTRCRVQARNLVAQDGNAASRKMKRNTSAMPLNVVSSAGSMNNSLHLLTGVESSELQSTATSGVKKQKTEVNQILLDEIKDINEKLIDTIIDVSDEDSDLSSATVEGKGIVIKCSYNAVALSQNMKSQYALAQISPILPLKLLIPSNYPKTSPILLDIQPVDVSVEGDDLSAKAQAKFNLSVRGLQQPMSLGEMARTWDDCARKVMEEYAQQTGGGSFSSRYGAWENWVSA